MRGGFKNLILTSKLAKDKGIWIAPHLFPKLTIHILASIQNSSWLEYMGWFDHLWVNFIMPIDGFMVPSNRPGHGMDFKPEVLNS
jgi:L-alanine-DL-glutamate epimerase-like enolase superfamily enzyme